MTVISNYVVVERSPDRCIGYVGSIKDGADMARQYAARTGKVYIVTNCGEEISGPIHFTTEQQ